MNQKYHNAEILKLKINILKFLLKLSLKMNTGFYSSIVMCGTILYFI